MESMKRGEADYSHHPKKVAINSLETESNKQTITSNVSGSNLNNNNKNSANQQQKQKSTTESKESNFEYDDNEWDVGGIGDLIIDLDNDIEKSSGTVAEVVPKTSTEQISCNSSSSTSSLSSLSTPSIASTSLASTTAKSIDNQTQQASPSSTIGGNKSKVSPTSDIATSGTMSSNASGQGAGKAGNKVAIDHQATLDKGLKMKIKRTKPGTKTSEAKHEIVKAEQNGLLSGADDSNSSSSGSSNGNKKSATQPPPVTAAQALVSSGNGGSISGGTVPPATQTNAASQPPQQQQISSSPIVTPTTNASTANKRTSSSHRRDKARDKNDKARDKNTHGAQSANHPITAAAPIASNNSNERMCNCTHDMNGSGASSNSQQAPCTSATCALLTPNNNLLTANSKILLRPINDALTDPLSATQRIAPPSIQANTNSSGTNVSALNSTGNAFGAQVNSTGTISTSSAPNAPGPPAAAKKDAKQTQQILAQSAASNNSPSSLNAQKQAKATDSIIEQKPTAANSNSKQKATDATNSDGGTVPLGLENGLSQIAMTGRQFVLNSAKLSSGHDNSICARGARDGSVEDGATPPPAKKIKCDPKDMVDVCVGTSVGTITEPDCLGPCEPGTSVTLEGIVWHETEGGVLVVNVTWRGKTYVGTLLDCTRHDWAPPRFCDSPTEELDARTPKGRAKRGRNAAQQPTNDLSNFTETRSSVHSKLRNASAKSRAARAAATNATTSTTSTTTSSTTTNAGSSSNSGSNTTNNTPSTSPTAFLAPRAEKRKSKDESSPPPPPPPPTNGSDTNDAVPSTATQSVINPVTGLNVQIPAKKVKSTAAPCAISPVLLECPEQDCSKKYKHANGLKYHQSHAHGAGSMDEDSQQLPESPPIQAPTTPSPNSAQQPVPSTTPTAPATISRSPTPPPSAPISGQNGSANAILPPVGNASAVLATSTPTIPPSGGGSITTGIAASVAAKLPDPPTPISLPSEGSLPNEGLQVGSMPLIAQQPLSLTSSNSIVQTPTKPDGQGKLKPGVLRFVPTPTTEGELGRLPPNSSPLAPLRAQANSIIGANAIVSSPVALVANQPAQALSMVKTQKKQRKDGTTAGNEFENTAREREDVQSPAYSDISDDSTPVAESEMSGMFKDKSQAVKHPGDVMPKKGSETIPSQAQMLTGYGMYPFYSHPQQPYIVPPPSQQVPPNEHSNGKSQPSANIPSLPPSALQDYNKLKEPPLDLMTKPASQPIDGMPPASLKDSNLSHSGPPPPVMSQAKFMGNFYPYNSYMPPGYPYNIDPNYGPVPMVTDDGKIAVAQPMIKEERLKESPSPNENPKNQSQAKAIKTESGIAKDLKQPPQSLPPQHEMHPKDISQSPIGAYTSMFQRHSLNVPQPQAQHIRDEELRRYYSMYPDQRRSSTSSNASSSNMPTIIKDEPQSPSQPIPSHASSQNQSHRDRDRNDHQQQPKNLKSMQQKSKDSKNDDKEPIKVKQEGQKPTMETQGPPPPPTSQYYIHPSYMGPGPFGFEPSGHPMYRNMNMMASAYGPGGYHLPISRFHAPEDLSRNPNSKALDLLQHHANQYYNPHKIHELSERALKSPTSNVKVTVSSPSITSQAQTQQSSANVNTSGGGGGGHSNLSNPNANSLSLNTQPPPPSSMPPGSGGSSLAKNNSIGSNAVGSDKLSGGGVGGVAGGNDMPPSKDGTNTGRSPPPQRHVHTHHHTHVGLGYPMYPTYGPAVLTTPAVIQPFPPGPAK